jgi:hypothetical protein
MTEFPAISLWQPWGSLPFARQPDGTDVKVHETRNRPAPPKYIGRRIVIHAAKQPIALGMLRPGLRDLCEVHFGHDFAKTLPRGAFIGTVVLEASTQIAQNSLSGPRVRPASDADQICGWWEIGRYAWRFAEPRVFAVPIEANGCQGWWPAQIEEEAA